MKKYLPKSFPTLSTLLWCLPLYLSVSCHVDHLWDKDYMFEVIEPHDGLFTVDCSSYTTWYFFSFETGGLVGSCDAGDASAYEGWRRRLDWDLAFHRQNIKTNSGASGSGAGGALRYPQTTFNFDDVRIAPDEGYATDAADSIVYDMSQMMTGNIGYVYTALSQPLKQWAVLADMISGLWIYDQATYVVRTASGKYAKIWLKNFKNDVGASGTLTMQYVYQADGTVNLDIQNEK